MTPPSRWDDVAPPVQIVATAVVAAALYGVLHDQVTARVCVEYFTVGHPPVFRTSDPTLLGLGWGIFATWWVGMILGVLLALAARAGSWPRIPPSALWRPVGVLLLCMGACSAVAGVLGYGAARGEVVFLVEPLASWVPKPKHHAFLADLWAHSVSYAVGFAGGAVVIVGAARWRYRTAATATGDPASCSQDDRAHEASRPSAPSERLRCTRTAFDVGVQLAGVPQLVLLYVAAIFVLGPVVTPPGGPDAGVLLFRLPGVIVALSALGLGVLAWRHQGALARLVGFVPCEPPAALARAGPVRSLGDRGLRPLSGSWRPRCGAGSHRPSPTHRPHRAHPRCDQVRDAISAGAGPASAERAN